MRSSRVLPIPIRIPLVNGIDSRPRDANLAEPGQFLPTHHASIDMRKQAVSLRIAADGLQISTVVA